MMQMEEAEEIFNAANGTIKQVPIIADKFDEQANEDLDNLASESSLKSKIQTQMDQED